MLKVMNLKKKRIFFWLSWCDDSNDIRDQNVDDVNDGADDDDDDDDECENLLWQCRQGKASCLCSCL